MKFVFQRFVQFPDTLKAGITAVVVYAFGWVFGLLFSAFPFLAFLSQYLQGIAPLAAAALIVWLQKTIPDKYGDVAMQALKLVLLILAMFGIGNGLASQFGVHALSLFAF